MIFVYSFIPKYFPIIPIVFVIQIFLLICFKAVRLLSCCVSKFQCFLKRSLLTKHKLKNLTGEAMFTQTKESFRS